MFGMKAKVGWFLAGVVGAAMATEMSLTVRPSGAVLLESIARESRAAVEQARKALAQRQTAEGAWELPDGRMTIFPALAMGNDTDRTQTVERAKQWAKAWRERQMGEISDDAPSKERVEWFCTTLLLSVEAKHSIALAMMVDAYGESRTNKAWQSMDWAPAWTNGVFTGLWPVTVQEEEDRERSAEVLKGWVEDGVFGGGKVIQPYELWWVIQLLDMMPLWRVQWAGVPEDWRVRLADRLVSRQQYGGLWEGSLWETACAIWALEMLLGD